MIDVLCIGTAVIDIMASPIPDKKEWLEKQRIRSIRLCLGGDGANQSVRMADLGWKCALVAALGADANGNILRGLLENRSVICDHLCFRDELSTGTALVLVDKNGERNTFSVAGAHSTLTKEDLPDLSLHRPGLISIASLFSLPYLEEDGLLSYLKQAKEQGILIAADLGSDKKKQGLNGILSFLPYLDYFWPSNYDAMQMTGTTSPETAAEVFLQKGCRHVVIKCGAKGCYYATSTERGWISALNVTPVDTTGAGDSMAAFLIDQILQGKGIKEACRFATTGASLATLYAGACDHKITRENIITW